MHNVRLQRCDFIRTHGEINTHKQSTTHTHTVSFSHANLTYESSWLCFNTVPPSLLSSPPLPSLFPSQCLTIHVTDGCCRQPQSYCCFLSLSGHLATARLGPDSTLAIRHRSHLQYTAVDAAGKWVGHPPRVTHSEMDLT